MYKSANFKYNKIQKLNQARLQRIKIFFKIKKKKKNLLYNIKFEILNF